MRDDFILCDAQDEANLTSTGVVSDNVLALELTKSGGDIPITDDYAVGYMNVVLTAVSFTSGGTQGIVLSLLTDDAAALTTAKSSSAGFRAIASKEVLLEDIVAGAKFSIPYLEPEVKSFLGAWLKAGSTTYTGTITFDVWLSNTPITGNETIQKVPA